LSRIPDQHSPRERAYSELVIVDTANLGFAYLDRLGQGFQQVIGDETDIHTVQHIEEPL